jgi:hypothetical protein
MSEPSPAVVAEVEAFCDRHEADPTSLELSGLRFLFDKPDVDEIAAALAELRARSNGTDPTE